MHLSDTEAAQRVADNDNLVGELVWMLKEVHAFLTNERIGTWQYMESSQFYSDAAKVAKQIAEVLAKAQGAQQ